MAGSQGKSQTQKDRSRNNYYRRQFGITLENYNRRLAEQNGRCKICGRCPFNGQANLAVDHKHFRVESYRELKMFIPGWRSTVAEYGVEVWAKTKAESVKLAKIAAMPKSIRGLLCFFCNKFIMGACDRHWVKELRGKPELFTLAEKYLRNSLTNNPNSSTIRG